MKQSKIGIKKLTAQYRDVLLKGVAIVAIMATSSTVKAVNTGAGYVDATDKATLATMASLKAQAENATFTPAGTAKNVASATTLNGAITDLDKAMLPEMQSVIYNIKITVM